jgi:sporulation protein YlmC with PRC-barrel domain
MAETSYTIGVSASCTDGTCGEVTRVVVDPVARAVTHLVVEPKHEHKHGRLVPVDLVDTVPGGIRLRCTRAELEKLDPAEETEFRPGSGHPGDLGYGSEQVLSWRYYGLNRGTGAGDGMGLDSSAGRGREHAIRAVTYDSVPLGEVEVRHRDCVHATDGEIGLVEGLVIDPRNHQVTHVLLQEGHLWGRKEVAIPIGAVTKFDIGIRLNISKQQVGALPPVDIHHHPTQDSS